MPGNILIKDANNNSVAAATDLLTFNAESAHGQVFKLVWGAAGVAVLVDATDAAALPVRQAALREDVDAARVTMQAAWVDRSGSISTGGASQQIAAANTARRYLLFQNISDTDMWLNIGAAAAATSGSFRIKTDGSLVFEGTFVPTGAVNVMCATSGKLFTLKEAP